MTSFGKLKRGFVFAAGTALSLIAHVAVAAPKPEESWGLPHDASVDGHLIDWLIQITGVFVTILFVIMCIWMAYACIKHGPKHEAVYDHGDSRKHIMTALLISSLIFVVVDGNLFVNSVRDLHNAFWDWDKPQNDPKVVKIEVNAHQWAWAARYAGPDGKFNTADDIVTLNDIRVPVNTPVLIELVSTDVIHSFYLPNFRIKQDAMPGMVNHIWFQAKETGEFDIACAQHCGTHHYKMKGQLTVYSEEDYKNWVQSASELSARAFDPDDAAAHWGWEWRKI
jgi:cytochrome c oxidase subunit II